MEEGKLYKYIIINKEDKEIVMKDSYRAIAEFINLIYTEDTISHTTVSMRLKNNNYFHYEGLIIKELIWR